MRGLCVALREASFANEHGRPEGDRGLLPSEKKSFSSKTHHGAMASRPAVATRLKAHLLIRF